MTEIRINRKQNAGEEYAEYSQIVQQYHRYDIYDRELSGNKTLDDRYIAEAKRRQLIILAGMNDNEYQELQRSLENHIVQKRINLKEQRQALLELASESPDGKIYTYCVEEAEGDAVEPLAVFDVHDMDAAERFAGEAAENKTDDSTIQISESLFDSDGNILGTNRIAFVVRSWTD